MSKKNHKYRQTLIILGAMAFVLAWLGLMLTLFPIGNPLETVGGTSGEGLVYAVLAGTVITFVIVLFFAIRSTIMDILRSAGDELGIDVDEIAEQYKKMVYEEYLVLTKQKDRSSDHYDEP